ncbi:MAG: alpha-amylase, partial [Calditrichaeota bacterium]
NAMGLIDEILHHVVALYRTTVAPGVFGDALDWLQAGLGEDEVRKTLLAFVNDFPPLAVYKGSVEPEAYLEGVTQGIPNRELALEELLMLWLENMNPAFSPYRELFDDRELASRTRYAELLKELDRFFATKPKFGPQSLSLIELLRLPARVKPDSLEEQLQFILQAWGELLHSFLARLLRSLDLLKEETRPRFGGPPPTKVAEFLGEESETERFSPDLHWMPRLVLIAKSTLVWLHQLSKKYRRGIQTLDQIPDEELDILARWGFTGLWLIGIWERSPASKRIKQLCGNPEAEASAYSLFDYEIAQELGGVDALHNLKSRCLQRGIRLACDMVPNHTGIDSRWVREHPEWFISLPYSPFPAYSFNGPNLSSDPRFGIFIEDKYYDRSDAAVVFKRMDYWTGDVRYIYHGNDGTHMPWNDTAQLNYLQPEVREAVLQKILHVARLFPVIRFDAAMTLTKRHFQRLWFPEPGSGGDIPSRAEHGLTKKEFDRAMPTEFWREVVDRVAQEVPDTLLLAEAFWLMEGYFVRTLGMHRVYNSAFMNMLKNEENAKYRKTVRNTLQFNPEILKRYVNFMNNPDEETAIAQFGDGDKYFGVCTLLATMPGLPMFGHGQIEGFSEKYGMEYRKSYWDEEVKEHLVARHEREIFPLLRKRYLFAEVENFLFYEFISPEGRVDENVFAYSNQSNGERGLVVYHNKYSETRGWVRFSVPFLHKTDDGEQRLMQRSLGQGLELQYRDDAFIIFRDHVTGLEYIRSSKEVCERGLYFELRAYEYHVLLDFREVVDDIWGHHAQVHEQLQGRGVASIQLEVKELSLRPLLQAFECMLSKEVAEEFVANRVRPKGPALRPDSLRRFKEKLLAFLVQVKHYSLGTGDETEVAESVVSQMEAALRLSQVARRFPMRGSKPYAAAVRYLKTLLNAGEMPWFVLWAWLLVHEIGRVAQEDGFPSRSRLWLDEWLLLTRITAFFRAIGLNDHQVDELGNLIPVLVKHQDWFKELLTGRDQNGPLRSLFADEEVRDFLKVNLFEDILWFNKERFEMLLWWLFCTAVIRLTAEKKASREQAAQRALTLHRTIVGWLDAATRSEYQVERLLRAGGNTRTGDKTERRRFAARKEVRTAVAKEKS